MRPTFVSLSEPFVGRAARMPADRRIWELAARQHGALATRQLRAAGLSSAQISRLVGRGWLRPMHRGVYVAGPIQSPRGRLIAATLAVGEGAVLSHRSAAELWDIGPAVSGGVAVTLVERASRSRDGITVHHSRRLDPADIRAHHGIPVTAPGRTLLDLATQLGRRDLAHAVEQAEILGLVSVASLNEQFSRYPRHRGARALRESIRATDAPAMTRSEAERRLLELVRTARLPEPVTNQPLHGHEVDFLWRAQRLVVEVDGYAFHSTRSAFERDRRRDADLIGAGYRVIRLTWPRLTGEPLAVAATLAAALAS